MSKADVAKKAALSYFGLSQARDGFPRGTKLEIFETFEGNVAPDEFVGALEALLKTKWTDNIGSMSRVSRISAHDLCAYANALKQKMGSAPLTPESPELEAIMRKLVGMNGALAMVKITHTKGVKLLLVNSEVTV